MIKAAQKRSDTEGKATAAHMSGLQSQFSDLDCKMSALQTSQQKLATDVSAMQDTNAQQFDELRANMISSMEVTHDMSQSMIDIRSQFTTMSAFMMELARKMEAVLHRCDGVPPEVNIHPHNGPHQNGSEFGSGPGDPSQSTTSDVSRAVSLLSSAGKRSLAASQAPVAHHEVHKANARPSPIKKKLRARGLSETPTANAPDATDDDEDETNQLNTNLDNRFRDADDNAEMDCDTSAPTNMQDPSDTSETESPASSNNGSNVAQSQHNHPTNQPTEAPPSPQYNEANDSAGAATE